MNQEHGVYDLGEVDIDNPNAPDPISIPRRRRIPRPSPETGTTEVSSGRQGRYGFEWRGSLSLVVPGAGAWLRGDRAGGLFHLCSLAFVAVFAWSLIHSMHRIVPTLELLEQRRELGIWTLGGLFLASAALYVSNLWNAVETGGGPARPHPYVAGAASFLVPGWGQLLNGDRFRAVCFISGMWIVLGAWILSMQETGDLLHRFDMYLPGALRTFSGPAVRYTLPAVIWTLAVYDAVGRARTSRERL